MGTENEFKEHVFKYFDGRAVLESDDLTVVIRAHLLIENIIEKILCKNIDLKTFEDRELTFNFKMKMAQSLGLLDDLYPAIQRLNKIRNEFAHNIETKIESTDIGIFIELYENAGYGNDFVWKAALKDKKACFGIVIHYILGKLDSLCGNIKTTPT